jgi:mevalonate kinase
MVNSRKEELELFVPGRLCLFGEHSDWAGGHRRQNSNIEKGYAIIAPTNQGNYAKVRKLDKRLLKFKSKKFGKLETKLNEKELLKIAEAGGNFSYVAGVAYEIIINYNNKENKGLEINNYYTDLPIKKGLSSSASICVLTARAFDKIFSLNWTKRREMDVAYKGEITTPSRCGRLDQACSYENPVLMTFDADKLEIEELKVGRDIYLLIVDLKGKKDTVKILAELNKGFPWPANKKEKRKHEYLGKINKEIVFRAKQLIKEGNAKKIGELMTKTQEKFDEYLSPFCPNELGKKGSPKLHKVLNFSKIQEFICGGKGVGSQGDGCAQLICKSKNARQKVKDILKKELLMECFDLDLKNN